MEKNSALATLHDIELQDLECIGAVFPQLNNGHKAIAYGAIAFGSHLATPAWITMGLFWWPATGIIISSGFAVHFLCKSLNSKRPAEPISTQPPTIGLNTKLEAIPTTAVEPPDQDVPKGVDPESLLGQLLASPYQSRALFGGQRTGKSMAMAIFTQMMAEQGTKVFHINLLSYTGKGDEDAQYTQHCTQSVRADFSKVTDPTKRKAKVGEALKVVEQWWDYPGEAILILDEFAYTASVAVPETEPMLRMLAEKLAAIASSGMKREHALYALAPTMVAAELQDAGKRIKSLSPVMVAISPGHTEQWKGQALEFDVALYGQVNRNFENCLSWPSPLSVPGESRIAFINGQWRALGTDKSMLKSAKSAQVADSKTVTTKTRVSPKVERFVQLITEVFHRSFSDKEKKGLGKLCEYGALKKVKATHGIEILIELLKSARENSLIDAYCENNTWFIYNPVFDSAEDDDPFSDIDFSEE